MRDILWKICLNGRSRFVCDVTRIAFPAIKTNEKGLMAVAAHSHQRLEFWMATTYGIFDTSLYIRIYEEMLILCVILTLYPVYRDTLSPGICFVCLASIA